MEVNNKIKIRLQYCVRRIVITLLVGEVFMQRALGSFKLNGIVCIVCFFSPLPTTSGLRVISFL